MPLTKPFCIIFLPPDLGNSNKKRINWSAVGLISWGPSDIVAGCRAFLSFLYIALVESHTCGFRIDASPGAGATEDCPTAAPPARVEPLAALHGRGRVKCEQWFCPEHTAAECWASWEQAEQKRAFRLPPPPVGRPVNHMGSLLEPEYQQPALPTNQGGDPSLRFSTDPLD